MDFRSALLIRKFSTKTKINFLHFAFSCNDDMLSQTNTNPAVQAIFKTKVHENDDPEAKFARAVYICPYINKYVVRDLLLQCCFQVCKCLDLHRFTVCEVIGQMYNPEEFFFLGNREYC